MTDSLAAACDSLARWLPAAGILTRHPDTDGSAGSGQPGSRPPWNSAAANAVLDPHEGVRRLEAYLRLQVTGHPGPKRGGSDANTMAALKAVENLAYGLPVNHDDVTDEDGRRKPCQCPHCRAVRFLERWTRPICELPAIDQSEPWLRVQGTTCPYCTIGTLRLQRRAGRVTCSRYGACTDTDGSHPAGFVQHSVSGDPIVAWNDGFIQHAAIEDDGLVAP